VASTVSRVRTINHKEALLGKRRIFAKILPAFDDWQCCSLGILSEEPFLNIHPWNADLFMDRNAHKEEFSYAYIHAVAAAAGYSCANATRLVDLEGIDITITALGFLGTRRCPRIDLQVKCTSRTDIVHDDCIKYPLEVPAYKKLIFDDPTIPYFLVVVLVPDSLEDWLIHSENELLLRHCGYWKSLAGEPETRNTDNITVQVPRTNLFTPEALKGFMRSLGAGGLT
jgi:Domain of unknown function (DUF4365)